MKTNIALVEKYMPLIRRKASQLSYRTSREEYNDLVCEGVLGFIQAADNFKLKKGVKFISFAWLRISGAMLDYLRKTSIREHHFKDVKISCLEDYSEPLCKEDKSFSDSDNQDLINSLTNMLSPRDRLIINMYYKKGLNRRQIGEKMDLDASRITQLMKHSIALMKRVGEELNNGIQMPELQGRV